MIIDCESLYYLERHEYPVHRQLHTFLGASLVGIATIFLLLGIRRQLPGVRSWLHTRTPVVCAEGTSLGIVVGAMVGALSHPVLDGLMHADIEPLQPWSADNPLRGLVGLEALHLGCVVAGILGAVLIAIWRVRERR